MTVQVDNRAEKRIAAYYGGTEKLPSFAALMCYTDAPTVASQLGFEVAKPATANLQYFAGFLAAGSQGKQGPCNVELIAGGAGVNAYVGSNTVKNSTIIAPQNGQWYAAATTGIGSIAAIYQAVAVAMVTDSTLGATPADTQVMFLRQYV